MGEQDVKLERIGGMWVVRLGDRVGDVHPGSPMCRILDAVVDGMFRPRSSGEASDGK